ncbi:MAG: fibronectin type III domain-containing protein [Bdellovibrionia bacterium]
MSNLGRMLTVFAVLGSLTACLDTSDGPTVIDGDTEVDVIDPAKVICNPIDDFVPTFLSRGLVGKLYYLTDDQPRYSSVDEFIPNAHAIDADLYFNRLFVPTRPFDRGFYTMDGTLVTNPDGEALYEYFGVEMETMIKLAPGQAPGNYQFAILADDGAMMRLHEAGGDTLIVNNDGVHPTKMGCQSGSLYMDANTKLPVQVRYHQGPRFHISLVMMMRPMPTDPTLQNDALCGQMGNSMYFDSTQNPPSAKPNFYALLERGWTVLEGSNFELPNPKNPCVIQEEPIEITNMALSSVTTSAVTVTWTTNVPGTTKVEYKATNGGTWVFTAENPALVTSHSVTVTGLTPNTLYTFKAFSNSASMQTAQSDERATRTQR